MVSAQNKQMAQFFASVTERMSPGDFDLPTIRDVYERLHLAASEPDGVSYAEVDIDGLPALWCIPEDSDGDHILLHAHGGGPVIFSMHVDRKAVGHIAKVGGARASSWTIDVRQNISSQLKFRTWERAYRWLLAKGIP